MIRIGLLLFLITSCAAKHKKEISAVHLPEKEVLEKYVTNGAHRYSYFEHEWQQYLDSAIMANPNIAYVYQQKAMPLFKMRKYEAGMPYLNRAVELDSVQYIDYRAFMKCIFSKDYSGAIKDFRKAKRIKGANGYVMDHSYDFHLGLSYLQLNRFDSAAHYLNKSIDYTQKLNGESWVHYLDLFYLGIVYLEQGKYNQSIVQFDKALNSYSTFSDAEYYKAKALARLGNEQAARVLFEKAKADFRKGYTINEDNAFYEKYPYQLFDWYFPKQ
jgi:tetratricopeptide (TPR) repeat protein